MNPFLIHSVDNVCVCVCIFSMNFRIMDFEYTPECIIFDLLRIPLYHGWLVDPQQREISRVINNQSYNQLVDRIIGSKTTNSNDNESE